MQAHWKRKGFPLDEYCDECDGVVDEDDYDCPHCGKHLKPLMDEADEEDYE